MLRYIRPYITTVETFLVSLGHGVSLEMIRRFQNQARTPARNYTWWKLFPAARARSAVVPNFRL